MSRNFFENEQITILHNQNAADIFKYSAGVKYNLITGRKTSCIRLTSAIFFSAKIALQVPKTDCLHLSSNVPLSSYNSIAIVMEHLAHRSSEGPGYSLSTYMTFTHHPI